MRPLEATVIKAADRRGVEAFAREIGFDLFGVADVAAMRGDFLLESATRDRFPLAVSLGKALSGAVLAAIDARPTLLYCHPYQQANNFIDRGALLVADFIQKAGGRALPIAASQIVDWENQKAHVSHKHVGRAAGLGWFGRNNLLVNPQLGSRFRLVTVLTDMPMEAGAPLERDCGPCRACVAACPAGAIRDSRADFDHKACYETLKDFRKIGYVSQFICGICVRDCRGPKP